ncbi:hypothetical protein FISHEDRAFT_59418 [Fistulina hepatica ATCC 64428]|uniref:Uncharacterized protein n=1 Tax=Fistulina hepatica ATCC 64428 TaxID=1128425 RepID=A0A0D7ABP8_9AGAR|nr:hypothetical protein FISHEDRAFT_59418 [Fistulina hepatica ATCC 64428]
MSVLRTQDVSDASKAPQAADTTASCSVKLLQLFLLAYVHIVGTFLEIIGCKDCMGLTPRHVTHKAALQMYEVTSFSPSKQKTKIHILKIFAEYFLKRKSLPPLPPGRPRIPLTGNVFNMSKEKAWETFTKRCSLYVREPSQGWMSKPQLESDANQSILLTPIKRNDRR